MLGGFLRITTVSIRRIEEFVPLSPSPCRLRETNDEARDNGIVNVALDGKRVLATFDELERGHARSRRPRPQARLHHQQRESAGCGEPHGRDRLCEAEEKPMRDSPRHFVAHLYQEWRGKK